MNPFDLIKNMGKIKAEMGQMQEKMAQIRVTGTAGGDMVKIVMDGQFQIHDVVLAEECVDPRDIPMLQDIIKAGINDAVSKVREALKTEMGGMPGMAGIPGMG
jgi:DNA-binding YbaB/EbfC family protein